MKLQRNATSAIKLATARSLAEGAISSGRLFFLEMSGDRIHSMNPDGSDRKTIVQEGLRDAQISRCGGRPAKILR